MRLKTFHTLKEEQSHKLKDFKELDEHQKTPCVTTFCGISIFDTLKSLSLFIYKENSSELKETNKSFTTDHLYVNLYHIYAQRWVNKGDLDFPQLNYTSCTHFLGKCFSVRRLSTLKFTCLRWIKEITQNTRRQARWIESQGYVY